jgi:endonuclease/exonuclease/phosphatase family metal-dependent hydrolase
VLALQEVDVGAKRSGSLDQALLAAEATGLQVVFGRATRLGWRGQYGNALLARGALADVEVVRLPRPGRREPRVAVLALADVAGTAVSVAATHLGVGYADAVAQLERVVAALVERPLPRLLVGDLNIAPEAATPIVERAGLTLVLGPPTFPSDAPRLQIDHVAVDGLRIASVEGPAAPVSDHRPLVVTTV